MPIFFSENLLKEQFPEVHKSLRGIISIDKVPKKLKKTEFVIINQSLLGESGTHWCILTRDISGAYEIFDSLGINDSKEKLIKRYVPEKLCVSYNVNQFQERSSSTCGLFW